MKAMIFAAGLGTRLKPLTDHLPKALVEVACKPLIQWQLERMRAIGCHDVTVNVHHFADLLEAWLMEHKGNDMTIRISSERDLLLDTGGAVRKARPLLLAGGAEPVLLHNVDILSNADLPQLQVHHEGHDATLLVSHRETRRYLLFDEGMRLVGWLNKATGEVRSPYPGLKAEQCRQLAFAGVHIFSPTLFPLMDSLPERFGIVDFYLSLCRERNIYGWEQEGLRLMDVGKIDTISEAESFASSL